MPSSVKTINILGATGSVGQSATDVILSEASRFDVRTVTAFNNAEKLAEQAIALKAKRAVLADEEHFEILQARLKNTGIEATCGQSALESAAAEKVDVTLAAIVGMAGLRPIMKALESSSTLAIANKEPLVAAGPLVVEAAEKYGTTLLPVDSEHNAIFQVFDFEYPEAVEKIILTASGGPFRAWSVNEMRTASPKQALAHPNWSMGRKISIDSATMMNKALEVVEAHYLFAIAPEKIEVLVHPQSVVHSMVEYKDGSVLAQMGASDMRTPLSHVLAWPERLRTPGQTLDLKTVSRLDFEAPDIEKFPALALAYECLRAGPYACVALNAANEVAVESFLTNHISFLDIINCVEHVLSDINKQDLSTIEDIENFDTLVREIARAYINKETTTKAVSAS